MTAEELRALLLYDEQTGLFTNRVKRKKAHVGQPAGSTKRSGYVRLVIGGRDYAAHRLAWLYVHGQWPTSMLDHINGVRSDNRIENLREVSPVVNAENRHRPGGSNPYVGVTFHKQTGKWQSMAKVNGKTLYLGLHTTPEAARASYLAGKEQIAP
jgi:hypothetical protein